MLWETWENKQTNKQKCLEKHREKPVLWTIRRSRKQWEQSIICRELLGCPVRQTHRQTLKHLLHMAQLQQGTRTSLAMQRRDLQNERLFASSLLVALQVSFQSEHASSSGLDSPSTSSVREQRWRKKILGGLGGLSQPSSAREEMVHLLLKKCSHRWKNVTKWVSRCCSYQDFYITWIVL